MYHIRYCTIVFIKLSCGGVGWSIVAWVGGGVGVYCLGG